MNLFYFNFLWAFAWDKMEQLEQNGQECTQKERAVKYLWPYLKSYLIKTVKNSYGTGRRLIHVFLSVDISCFENREV